MKYIYLFVIIFSFSACSIFQTSNNEEQSSKTDTPEEVYVFDDVSEEDVKSDDLKKVSEEINNTISEPDTEKSVFEDSEESENLSQTNDNLKYYIQIGAFSSLNRAEDFVNKVKTKAPFDLSIIYKSSTSLYTVRSKAIGSREEADKIKQDLWNNNLFKDAFIITE